MKKIVLITTAVLGCVCMMACGGKAEKVDYDNEPGLQATQATEQTQDPEVTQEVEATQTPEQILSLAEDVVEEYNTGSKNYETTKEYLSSLQESHEISELEDYMETVEVLKTSKENYAKAEVFAEAGETVRAIELYSKVDKQDVQYSEATTKKDQLLTEYKKDIFQAAKESANNKEYDEAIAVLDAAKGVLGKDAEWEAMMESYELQKEKQDIAELLKEVSELTDKGEYAEAIELLNPYKDAINTELTKALSTCRVSYKEEMVTKAEKLAKSKDYVEAVGVLKEAISLLGEDKELSGKIEEYKLKYPMSLVELEMYKGVDFSTDEASENIFGEKLENGIIVNGSAKFGYVLNNEFETFTSDIFVNKDAFDQFEGRVKIFVDDVEKYDSGIMKKTNRSQHVEIDVANATFIEFRVEASSAGNRRFVCISKPMLYK